ncbi:hypothetical protein MTP99_005369 [Tenebrio molitor]|nr:hypothetical protein MTP99_005369 [Tenebrio molitor]
MAPVSRFREVSSSPVSERGSRTACVRWSEETPGCEGEHEDFDRIARNVASQDLVLQGLALEKHPNVHVRSYIMYQAKRMRNSDRFLPSIG